MITHLLGNSEDAKHLRNNVIFKIIPMLNPDGVIIGNTRTSFAGKDLNRRYYKNTEFVFPEIIGVMDYVSKLKSRYQSKLLFLIDVHGHSTRKNSFFYGP
jgi:murein tripeptide amidase MpaA